MIFNCRLHYKEYLVDKINRNRLDPITIYATDKIKIMLSREELKVPTINEGNDDDEDEDGEEETEEQFRERLIKVCVVV